MNSFVNAEVGAWFLTKILNSAFSPLPWGILAHQLSDAPLQQGLLGGCSVTFNLFCDGLFCDGLLLKKIFCCLVWFYTNITEKPSDGECAAPIFSVIYALVYPARQPTYPREQYESVWAKITSHSAMACWVGGLNQLLEDDIGKYNLQRDSVQFLSLLSVLKEYSRGSVQFYSNPFGFIFSFLCACFSAKQLPTAAIC